MPVTASLPTQQPRNSTASRVSGCKTCEQAQILSVQPLRDADSELLGVSDEGPVGWRACLHLPSSALQSYPPSSLHG